MCCFSQPVQSVSATKIFARAFPPGPERERQFIVYSMSIKARQDLAMVLPIPVKPKSGEHALRFINLKEYPTFFDALEAGFPPEVVALGLRSAVATTPDTLKVHEVGDFEASHVPTTAAFSRLDARFRLPAGTWEKLPQYRSYGFAVFKLKPGAKTIHPMAFSFPRSDANSIFFPTVHIHDGQVHAKANFDHVLYCQRNAGARFQLSNWRESPELAKRFVNINKAHGIVDPGQHCYRQELSGNLKNADTILG